MDSSPRVRTAESAEMFWCASVSDGGSVISSHLRLISKVSTKVLCPNCTLTQPNILQNIGNNSKSECNIHYLPSVELHAAFTQNARSSLLVSVDDERQSLIHLPHLLSASVRRSPTCSLYLYCVIRKSVLTGCHHLNLSHWVTHFFLSLR